jgi:hypothetical protein
MQNQAGAAAGQQAPPQQQGQQAPQGQPAPPPGPVQCARNPAKWSQLTELDYGNKQDRDNYKTATEKLEGYLYDWKNLSLFLKKLEGKAQQYNWIALLTYEVGTPPREKCLLTNYGEVKRTDVAQKAGQYLGTNNREEQDSDMIFNCLRKSITDTVFAQVTTEPDRYTFTSTTNSS